MRPGNYLVKLLELDLTPSTINLVTVHHDDWCAFWSGGRCDCDPDLECRPAETEAR